MTLISILLAIVAIVVLVIIFFRTAPQIGAQPDGDRLTEVKASENYKNDLFVNSANIQTEFPMSKSIEIMGKMMVNTKPREPQQQIETMPFDPKVWENRAESEILMSWFGHSSALIKIDSKTILIDPVFGERASMFSFLGPKKFDYSNYMSVDLLPTVDLVIISHDHYDHLDYPTILKLKECVKKFFVPLGVAAHLEAWGVPADNIQSFDWWEDAQLDENIKLTFAPTQHFSGRSLSDRMKTLWGSWIIEGSTQKMYFSGDSGYFSGFNDIGEKFGPFDFAMIECGAYNDKDWGDIHMMPNESVQAALDVKAKLAMPIHWGKFNLALHPWREPVQWFLNAAEEQQLNTHTPLVGEIISIPNESYNSKWWQTIAD